MDDFLHPDLVGRDQVTIERFESNKMKRGLQEDETPFPVIEKAGPYLVSIVKSVANYFCVYRLKTPSTALRTTSGAAVV